MITDGKFGSNLLDIYNAAFARDRWTSALDAMVSGTSVRAAMLYETSDTHHVPFKVNAVSATYANMPERVAGYMDMIEATNGGSGMDREGTSRLHLREPFIPHEESSFWPLDEVYNNRPEIQYALKELGSYRRFVINLSEDPLSYRGAVFHYGLEYKNIPSKDLWSVARFAPHMAKSVELNRLSFSLREKYNAVLSVLDKFDLGICILNANGNVILKNARAERIFGDRDGLWMHADGSIICRDRDDTARLKDAVRRIALTADGQNDDRGDEFTIKRLSTQEPILAIASPLRDSDMELEKGLSGTLLTLIDTSSTVSARLDTFAKAYQLTPAETKVAALLFEGYTNTEIGDHLNASPETAKSHVASILRKTQCSHRINFVWRVFQFAPPVL